jgi:hypothetical protein
MCPCLSSTLAAAAALLFAVALSTPADATPSANGVEERGSAAWSTSSLVTTQLEEPDTKDLVKMKAAVHAAAQIKKTAISMNHLPTQDSKVTPAPGLAPPPFSYPLTLAISFLDLIQALRAWLFLSLSLLDLIQTLRISRGQQRSKISHHAAAASTHQRTSP